MDKYKLEYEMHRRHITVEILCNEIGMSRSAFYRKMKGTSDFTLSEINKICSFLDINPIGIFFTGKCPKSYL